MVRSLRASWLIDDLLSYVADLPDGVRSIVADEQRAVVGNGYAHGTPPNIAAFSDKAGEEVLVLAAGPAVLHRHADDLIAGALFAVPGAVLGSKGIAAILFRKLLAFIEGHFQRSKVRLQDHIGGDDLVLELRMFSLMARIGVAAHVIPGPAVEASVLHMRDVVGHQVIAQPVALIDRAPQLARLWING